MDKLDVILKTINMVLALFLAITYGIAGGTLLCVLWGLSSAMWGLNLFITFKGRKK